jgi:cell division protein FtsZ
MVKEGLINLDFADVRAIMREMGKAMMGTGEATGERRAILAAEAAIANPLLDETSMRGARGLLISITGGNDLTLYEVDEAASRIRQEVDEEANIILGATFDESLDGIVRVSVVATGIDTPAKHISAAEVRIAEAAQKLRVQATGARPELDRFQPQATFAPAPAPEHAPEREEEAAPQSYYSAPQPAPAAYAPVPSMEDVQLEQQTRARPAPTMFTPPAAPVDYAPQHAPGPFTPPAPERVVRGPRMPTHDEFPPQIQKQLAAQRGEVPAEAGPESKRRSLLERLASFGMKASDEPAPVQARPRAPMAPSMQNTAQAPAPAPRPQLPPSQTHADYGRRPQAPIAPAPSRQQQLDLHGRAAPARSIEDDHLEIPAFLRRQSS